MIAAYSTYDGWAIVSLGLDPLPYLAVGIAAQLLVVTGLLRGDVRAGLVQLRRHHRPIAVLAVLIPTSYALALIAMQHAPVSVVTAVRASSVIWGGSGRCRLPARASAAGTRCGLGADGAAVVAMIA